MPFTLTMPKLSPTMEEGVIAKWHKKIGDKVKSGDLLLEVATDKATVEYNALDGGYLRQILIPEGGPAIVNQAIAIFTEEKEESIEGYQPEGIQPVKQVEEPLSSIEKTKKESATVSMAQPRFAPEAPLVNVDFNFPTGAPELRIKASPLAKKLAKTKGIDLTSVKGTGPRGRITSKDLNLGLPDQPANFARREKPTFAAGTFEEVPLSPMRKVIAERLQAAKTFIPHIYLRQQVNAASLITIREDLLAGNIKITFNDLVIRAVALSLKEYPSLNSGFSSVNQSVILFKTIDISVAVTVPGGLITPIIRYADYKNLGEISVEMKSLATRAKEGKLQEHEYKGGSFTISNLGMFGIDEFAAIINPPQAAILAVGAIQDAPIIKNGSVKAGKSMILTLSADHRVVDGADAAQFLKCVQKYLENPSLLLI
jgi:pyruvate dehydrogenase E2 component (dihydrolipoamide acetyltransferase)